MAEHQFLCGGEPSESDLEKVAQFAHALAQPTPAATRVEILRIMANDGDTEAARLVAEHDRNNRGETDAGLSV